MDRISSDPAIWCPNGEIVVDRDRCEVERDILPSGELVLEGSPEEVGERLGDDELTFGSNKEDVNGWDDWIFSETLVLETISGAPGEKGGGGLTGATSSGDVMDTSGPLENSKYRYFGGVLRASITGGRILR
jgi:hypothetical protein